ncbi:MAG: hypothetical protein ACE5JH_04635 [Acidobacteriota bacterium]
MRLIRLSLGALVALILLPTAWFFGILTPPEPIVRWAVAFASIYPGDRSAAEMEEVPCPPLRHLRLYVLCTAGCDDVWKIVGVRGLRVRTLANLGRLPPEPRGEVRARINAAVAREDLRLDADAARQMVGCYMRLDGLHPALILEEPDLRRVARARRSEEAMRALAESLDVAGAIERIDVRQTADGFEASLLYWDTSREERPVARLRYRLARDGRIEEVTVSDLPVTDGTVSGSTPGRLPS